MTVIYPGMSVPDSQILGLLRQVVDTGRYRGTWTLHDVARVFGLHIAPLAEPGDDRPIGVPWQAPDLDRPPTEVVLTARQGDVLTGICRGYTNRQLAGWLGISEDSVNSTVRRVLAHFQAGSRQEVAVRVLSGQVLVRIRDIRRQA